MGAEAARTARTSDCRRIASWYAPEHVRRKEVEEQMPRYFGLDVHKSYVHGCELRVDEAGNPGERHLRFPNCPEAWAQFTAGLGQDTRVALEVTGSAFEVHDNPGPARPASGGGQPRSHAASGRWPAHGSPGCGTSGTARLQCVVSKRSSRSSSASCRLEPPLAEALGVLGGHPAILGAGRCQPVPAS